LGQMGLKAVRERMPTYRIGTSIDPCHDGYEERGP
jgi:hypothetical protein